MVPVALLFVDVMRDETGLVAAMAGFQGLLIVFADAGIFGGGLKRCTFEVEAEQRVGKEIVERGPGSVPVVG